MEMCEGVHIHRAQLSLIRARTLFLFVVVSAFGEEVVLHIHDE